MKNIPILPKGDLVLTNDITDYIGWLLIFGLHDTVEIQFLGYNYDLVQNIELIRMKHKGFWSKVSI